MHTRFTRSVLAAAAAASAVAGLVLAGAVTASASGGTAALTTRYDTSFAGYVTGGAWRFRHVDANIPMAACQSTPGNNAVASIALSSNVAGDVAHIDMRCGGGPDSVTFGTVASAHGAFNLTPAVGDVMRLSIFRNVASCSDEFLATNTRTGRTQKVTIKTACTVVYRHAILGAFLVNPSGVVPPPSPLRLWRFRNAHVTSYNATPGTVCGPWPTDKFIATTTGTVTGKVLAYPGAPSNSCHDFAIWLNGAS